MSLFHATAALGASDASLMALLVDGRAVGHGLDLCTAIPVIVGKDIALAEEGVTGRGGHEVQIAMPLRQIDDKVVGDFFVSFPKGDKPVLQDTESLGVEIEVDFGIVLADLGVQFQLGFALNLSRSVEAEILNHVLFAILLDGSA